MELFWSWCLSTLINVHRETPDGKREREGERMKEQRRKFGEKSTVEEDDHRERERERERAGRGRRWRERKKD